MQLSDGDRIRKCVAFLGYRKSGKAYIRGTAFFVDYKNHHYMVTAKHNLLSAQHAGAKKLLLRINNVSSGTNDLETEFSQWVTDIDDPCLDAAVYPIRNHLLTLDVLAYPASNHVTQDTITQMPIGVGDDVFFPGLFVQHASGERNVPVVRTGSIAAMAEEKVRVEWFGNRVLIDAYLVEARSIGGLSGSPVFVHFPIRRRRTIENGKPVINIVTKVTEHCLLGLIHGHYDERVNVSGERKAQSINTGMAIVVPFTKVMGILEKRF